METCHCPSGSPNANSLPPYTKYKEYLVQTSSEQGFADMLLVLQQFENGGIEKNDLKLPGFLSIIAFNTPIFEGFQVFPKSSI